MAQICDVVDIPVIADMDTGYGNALNARRAARDFVRAGVAAVHHRGSDLSEEMRAL